MVRWLMPLLPRSGPHLYVHNALVAAFMVAFVASVVAIISALCSSCHKKQKQRDSSTAPRSNQSPPEKTTRNSEFEVTTAPKLHLQHNVNKNNPSISQKEQAKVELTPDVATHGPIPPAVLPSSVSRSSSRRRLSMSLSKKIPDIMRASRKEKQQSVEPGDDMIWKKAIILGEKCRVPTDDEEEGGVKNYYPKTPRSRPMSRASSFAYHDVEARTSSVAHSDLNHERREE